MEKLKKLGLYLIVIILVAIICILFVKIFAFGKNDKTDNSLAESVTNELVEQLYSYIPSTSASGIYSSYFTTSNNISYSLMGNMVYNYLLNYDSSKLETLSNEELSRANLNGTPVHKLNTDNFNEGLKKVFGEDVKYSFGDFNVDINTVAKYTNNYFYIYKKEETNSLDYEVFKKMTKYTVADNGKTIKIYDCYLKCIKSTGLCYTDDKGTVKSSVTYSPSLNIDNYVKQLKEYVHTFKYNDKGYYYWANTEAA